MSKITTRVIVGIFLGFLFSKLQFFHGFTLLPWGITAFILGYICTTRKETIVVGISYGFFLGFTFMLSIYQGSAPIISRIPFFAILGVMSAICATILSFGGYMIKSKLKK